MNPSHKSEWELDEELEDSFPASDPPSHTPATSTKNAGETAAAHATGEHKPRGMPSDDRHATETAGARIDGAHPAEAHNPAQK